MNSFMHIIITIVIQVEMGRSIHDDICVDNVAWVESIFIFEIAFGRPI